MSIPACIGQMFRTYEQNVQLRVAEAAEIMRKSYH